MTLYDAMLTNRARMWALLCMSGRAGAAAPAGRLLDRDAVDGQALLDRLEAGGLVTPEDGGYRLTEFGRDAARRTLVDGTPPAIVMHDPAEWRQRAWMAIRIFRTFTAGDIAKVAGAPSYDAVQRYCAALVDSRHAAREADAVRGFERVHSYRLIGVDAGPMCPVSRRRPAPGADEADPRQPWRGRAWRACLRLGHAGQGFTTAEVAVAASAPVRRTMKLLVSLVEAGALVAGERVGATPGGGSAVLYGLTVDAEDRARPLVSHDPWRHRAWDILRSSSEPMTAVALTAAVGTVDERTIRDYLNVLADHGHAVRRPAARTEIKGPSPVGYVVADGAGPAAPIMPDGRTLKKARQAAARAEESHA